MDVYYFARLTVGALPMLGVERESGRREDRRGWILECLYLLSDVGMEFDEVLDLLVNRGSPFSIVLLSSPKSRRKE